MKFLLIWLKEIIFWSHFAYKIQNSQQKKKKKKYSIIDVANPISKLKLKTKTLAVKTTTTKKLINDAYHILIGCKL